MFIDLSLPMFIAPGSDEDVSERDLSVMRAGHKGTHLDRVLGTPIPLDYFKSKGVTVDISGISRERPVDIRDVASIPVERGDFVIFHTGALLRNPYGSKGYLSEYIEFSWELIRFLTETRVRFIGIDARGIRMNEEHRQADEFCERAGVYVIENLNNTHLLRPGAPCGVYAAWFDLGGTGLPCRVTAEVA